jgi:hypothetical protein
MPNPVIKLCLKIYLIIGMVFLTIYISDHALTTAIRRDIKTSETQPTHCMIGRHLN